VSDVDLAPGHKWGLTLANPVMAASGSLGYGSPRPLLVDPSTLGAVVTSPVSLRPRRGALPPRASIRPHGFILRTGGANPGVERVLAMNARRWEELPTPVIVHAVAREPSEMASLMDRLEESPAAGVEIDVGPTRDLEILRAACTGSLPVLARVPLIGALDWALQAVGAGACAVVVAAPPVGIAPGPGGPMRGEWHALALLPLLLDALAAVREAVTVPLVGSGGVHSIGDARAILELGADAVQLDDILFLDPRKAMDIVRHLKTNPGGEVECER
jgi:dihydroorotate dehydrogenase (NAD+) catalytic subunit